MLGDTFVITFELDRPYKIDAILVLGAGDLIDDQISEFNIHVGYDSDYSNNTPCPNGPFAYPKTSDFGTYKWKVNAIGAR